MNEVLKNPEAIAAYKSFLRVRLKGRLGLFFNLTLWGLCTAVLCYHYFIGIAHVRIGIQTQNYNTADRFFYELPLAWLVMLIIQFSFYYAESIPGLKNWQDRLERREFERLKKTYEYQMKL
ncbi:MAG: hypothetical protein LBE34_09430 [Flavobacteriaceae bacterium]|jgi:prolipoprotein diacylglyceryltransferase|nr:hypothetical protein [Flavobacteriaceae bacterium]